MSQPHPTPSNPLPWRIANNRPNTLVDLSGETVGLLKGDSAEFVAFMSRFGPKAFDIVRGLAEFAADEKADMTDLLKVSDDAAELWSEMQRKAKGGGE